MPAEIKKEIELEIGHVLFIDIVGYSKLLIDEQRDYLHTLNEVIKRTDSFRAADAAGKLTRLPTGDGMALVFATTPDAPRFLRDRDQQCTAEPPGTAGAHRNPQRSGQRDYRCE